jgi:hypothetical protein
MEEPRLQYFTKARKMFLWPAMLMFWGTICGARLSTIK